MFASGLDDGWAAFRVQTSAYAWSGEAEKHSRLVGLVGALEALATDLQIVRVSRRWGSDRYREDLGRRGPGAREGGPRAHRRQNALRAPASGSARGDGAVAAGRVHLRQPARTGEGRGLLPLRCRLAAPPTTGRGPSPGALATHEAFHDGAGTRAREGCRRAGARTDRGLPRRAAGADGGAPVAGQARLLPRRRRTRRGRPARAAGGRLRVQRKSGARAARGRPDALDRRGRGAPRTLARGSSRSAGTAGRRISCWAPCPSGWTSRALGQS